MKSYFINTNSEDKLSFELSRFNKIDSKKYTLFDVLADPRLDQLGISQRLGILNSWYEDMEENNQVTHQRYAFDGCRTERQIFDPLTGKAVRMINFGSNDYLNMSQHRSVVNAGIEALLKYGAGAGAACNASGQTLVKTQLEQEIADTLGYEKALVYPSGFTTNTGILSALLRSNDVAVVDMLAHASIMDGVAHRHKMMFRHNDMRSLESILRRADRQYADKIVVVDGVYSMDGDMANLPDIAGLCQKYKALLMVDEAHAFGVIGKNGLGILDHFQMSPDKVDILAGTLSKAIGCAGGFVTGKKELINYLKLASRPYFFTTAPFIASNAAALESIRIIKQDTGRRTRLWSNIEYFKGKLSYWGFNTGQGQTAIFPIVFGDHNKVIALTQLMGRQGVLVNGIPYPAVPRKQTRIRMTVTADMTTEQMDKAYAALCRSIVQYRSGEYEHGMKGGYAYAEVRRAG